MIDPNIALQARITPTPDPLDAYQQVANIKQMGQQTQALTMENAERQRAVAARDVLNESLKANTKLDPVTQAPVIDYDGVTNTLTQRGYGKEAMAFKTNVNAMKEADTRLTQLNDQMRNDHAAHVSGWLGTVLDAPEAARPQIYSRVRQQAIQAKYIQPSDLPEQYSPEMAGQLASMRDQALTVQQQYGNKFNEERIGAAETAAQAAMERAAATQKHWEEMEKFYQQRLQDAQDKLNNGRYTPTPNVDRAGHPLVFDRQTGRYIVQPDVNGVQRPGDENPDSSGAGPGRGRQQTPDNIANQFRSNQTDYEKATKEEGTLNSDRSRLGAALKNGTYYIDSKGKAIPFKSGARGGEEMTPEEIAAAKADMQTRFDASTTRLKQVISLKNDAMMRNGVQPGVSTAQAIQALDGPAPSPPSATPKPAAAPPAAAPAPVPAPPQPAAPAPVPPQPAAPAPAKQAGPLAPAQPVKPGSKGVAPKSKIQAYAKRKGIPYGQAETEFKNFGYQIGQ